MNIFVSTKETQGHRKNDFCFVPDNEPVLFGFACDCESVDGKCGCKRSLVGAYCHTATTTFKIVNTPMSKRDYVERMIQSSRDAGWPIDKNKELYSAVYDDIQEILKIAEYFNDGDILERRGRKIQTRQRIS